jgi:hypothetical protein
MMLFGEIKKDVNRFKSLSVHHLIPVLLNYHVSFSTFAISIK